MIFPEERIPGIVITGKELGQDLSDKIERIQALYQLQGKRFSKVGICVMLIEKGVPVIEAELQEQKKTG